MKKFAVIGSPILHSLSPKIHLDFAKKLDIEITYEAIEVNQNTFVRKLKNMFKQGYDGINVTLPLKELAYQLAEEITIRGIEAQAVNTLWISRNRICADSTDGIGLIEDFNQNAITIKNSKILLLGAGGAARSILPSLLSKEPDTITIFNRTASKSKALAKLFSQTKTEICDSGPGKSIKQGFTGIINASSAELLNQKAVLPDNIFDQVLWVYDLSYSKNETKFISLAKQNGVKICIDGLGMLVHQAAKSFEMWTGKAPEVHKTLDYLRESLLREKG